MYIIDPIIKYVMLSNKCVITVQLACNRTAHAGICIVFRQKKHRLSLGAAKTQARIHHVLKLTHHFLC